ncbi:MAG TPA: exosortase H [Dokdonella sp.]|uniref:exosortase H n=1 Tax=Dokdonella sp. TaxID=2291710 RepID=UPI0025C06B1B|nr:exosortase H [Dokdonella sp.]MBX3690892.1 exosortase H [Dokdonella sp.]MCW5568555.1 exosortase H [Dokdonella sp.]HNR91408.1 exosortase H [Dokdonella sp.]
MLRFLLIFLVLLLVMFVAELTPPVEHYVIEPFTAMLADACAWIIHWFDPSTRSSGKFIEGGDGTFLVSIERGCNGIEAVIILFAAILAFPAPWKHKIAGLGAGLVAVQLLNIVRIVSLFFLGLWHRTWFEWFHLYLWQALIVLDALIVFLVWLRMVPRLGSVQSTMRQAGAASP